jgi:hypothetical protein
MLYNSSPNGSYDVSSLSTLPTKGVFSVISVLVIQWQELPMVIKKKNLPSFVIVKAFNQKPFNM